MNLNNLRKNKVFSTITAFTFFLLQSHVLWAQAVIDNALPQNPTTVVGSATYNYAGNTLTQTSTTDKTATDWNGGMNTGKANTWNIVQPGSGSVWLNRDVSGNPSAFWGGLHSNGNVFLENANGVFFGAGSHVDVNGLVASTLHISNNDFSNGNYKFSQNGGPSYVANQGNIQVTNGGYVLLLSNAVSNSGSIVANLGKVILAAGQQMTAVGLDDNSDISVTIDDAVKNGVLGPNGQKMTNAVENSGTIQADAGHIVLNAKVLNNIFDYAVNNSGVVQANSLSNKNGVIELTAAGGDIKVANGSVISAKAGDATSNGGSVKIYSDQNVNVEQDAVIDISGGSDAGNGGAVDLSAEGDVSFAGSLNAQAADGYSQGSMIIDPTNANFSGTIFGGTTTVWATNNINITADAFLLLGATVNLFADHTSSTSNAWQDGVGVISNTGNHTIFGGLLPTTLNLKAGSGIGSSGSPILVSNVSSVSLEMNPTSGSGSANVTNTGINTFKVSSASTRDGDINLKSTNTGINLAGAVSAGTGTVALNGAGAITQSGAITADKLQVISTSGATTLNNSGNHVNTIAANTKGALQYTDSGALSVGSVNSTNGITTSNSNVTLKTGDTLTLNNDINVGKATVVLNPTSGGVNQVAGAISAANLLLSGAGSFGLGLLNNVSNIAANVTGALTFKNSADLKIGSVNGTDGITATSVDVTNATGNMTVANTVTATGGGLKLTSTEGDLTVQAGVYDGSHDITLTAGNDFNEESTGEIWSSSGVIDIEATRDANFNGNAYSNNQFTVNVGRDIVQNGGSLGTNNVNLTAGRDIIQNWGVIGGDNVSLKATNNIVQNDGWIQGWGVAATKITVDAGNEIKQSATGFYHDVIWATNLVLKAVNGIGKDSAIKTKVVNLQANNTNNDINVINTGDLILKDIDNGNGNSVSNGGKIDISSDNDLTVLNGVSNGSHDTTLKAGRDFILSSTGEVWSSSGLIDLEAGRDALLSGNAYSGNELDLNAVRDIIQNGGTIGLGSIYLTAGNDIVQNWGYFAADNVSLKATHDIVQNDGWIQGWGQAATKITLDAGNEIKQSATGFYHDVIWATNLVMKAVNGIGKDSAIKTVVTNLQASNTNNDINVDNTGALTLKDINSTGSSVTNTHGNINIAAHSPLTVDDAVSAGGDITLTAGGTTDADDLTVNADVKSTNSGKITFNAGHDFIQNGGDISTAADIFINANNDIYQSGGTISADSLNLTATNGAIYGTSVEDTFFSNNAHDYFSVSVNKLSASAGTSADIYNDKSVELVDVQAGSELSIVADGDVNVDYVSAPTVTIEAQNGSIVGSDNSGNPNIEGDSAYLYAYDSIFGGTSEGIYYNNNWSNFLVTNVNYLEAVADGSIVDEGSTTGYIDIYNNKSVELGNIVLNSNQSEVTVIADGDMNVDYVSALNTVTLEAQDGSVIGNEIKGVNVDTRSLYLYASDAIYGDNSIVNNYYGNNGEHLAPKGFFTTGASDVWANADSRINIYDNSNVTLHDVEATGLTPSDVDIISNGNISVGYVSAGQQVTLESQDGSIIGLNNSKNGVDINTKNLYLYAADSIYGAYDPDMYYAGHDGGEGFLKTNASDIWAHSAARINMYDTGAVTLDDVETFGSIPASVDVISSGDMTVGYVSDANDVTLESQEGSIIGDRGDSSIDTNDLYLYAYDSIYGNASESIHYLDNPANGFLVTNVNYLEAVADGNGIESSSIPTNGSIDIYNNKSVELGNVVVNADQGEVTVVANGDVNVDYVSAPDTVTLEAQDGSVIGAGENQVDVNTNSLYLYASDSIYGNTDGDRYYSGYNLNQNEFLTTNAGYLEAVADGDNSAIDIYVANSAELGNVVANGETSLIVNGTATVDYVSAPTVTIEAQNGSIIGADNGGDSNIDADSAYLYATISIYGNTSEDTYYDNNWNDFLVTNVNYLEAVATGATFKISDDDSVTLLSNINIYNTKSVELGKVTATNEATVIANGDVNVDYVSAPTVTLEAHNGSIIGADNGGDSNIDADSAYLYATNSIYGNTSEDSYYGNNTNDFLVTNVNYLEAVVDGQTWGDVITANVPVDSSTNGFIDIYNNKSVELGNVVVSTDTGEATVVADGDVNVDYVSAPDTVTLEAQDGSVIGANKNKVDVSTDDLYLYASDSIYGNADGNRYYADYKLNQYSFLTTNADYLEAVADGDNSAIDIYVNNSAELGNVEANGETSLIVNGTATVDYVSAPTVTIEARDGSIIGADNGGDVNIDANNLYLYASSDIYGNTEENSYYSGNHTSDFLVTDAGYLHAIANGDGGYIDIYDTGSVELSDVEAQNEAVVVADGHINVGYVSAIDVTLEAQDGSVIGNNENDVDINAEALYLYASDSIYGGYTPDMYYAHNGGESFLKTNASDIWAHAADRINLYDTGNVTLDDVETFGKISKSIDVISNGDMTVDYVSDANDVTLESQEGSIIGADNGGDSNIDTNELYLYAYDSIYGNTSEDTYYENNANDFLVTNVNYLEAVADGNGTESSSAPTNGSIDIYNNKSVELGNIVVNANQGEATVVANGDVNVDYVSAPDTVTLEAQDGSVIGSNADGEGFDVSTSSLYLYATDSVYGNFNSTKPKVHFNNQDNNFLITNAGYIKAVAAGEIDVADPNKVEVNLASSGDQVVAISLSDILVDWASSPDAVTLESFNGSIIGQGINEVDVDASNLYLYAGGSIYGGYEPNRYYTGHNGGKNFLKTNASDVWANAGTRINLYDTDSVTLDDVETTGLTPASVDVISNGDMTVGYVSDANDVTLESQEGSIIGKDNGGDNNIDTNELYLYAYDSIYGNTSEDTYYENNANDFLVTNVNYLEAVADGNGVESSSVPTNGSIDIYNNKSVELGNVVVNADQGEVTVVADGDVNVDYVSAPDTVTLEAQDGSVIGANKNKVDVSTDDLYLYASDSIYGNADGNRYYADYKLNQYSFLTTNADYLEAVADGDNSAIDIYVNNSAELGNVEANGETSLIVNGTATVDYVSASTVTIEAQNGSIIGADNGGDSNIDADSAYLYATNSIYGNTSEDSYYGNNTNDFLVTNVNYLEAVVDGQTWGSVSSDAAPVESSSNGFIDIYNNKSVELGNVVVSTDTGEATVVANGDVNVDYVSAPTVTIEAQDGSIIGKDNGGDSNIDADSAYLYAYDSIYGNTSEDTYYENNANDFLVTNVNYLEAVADGNGVESESSSTIGNIDIYNNKSVELGNVVVNANQGEVTVVADGDVNVDYVSAPDMVTLEAQDGSIIGAGENKVDVNANNLYLYASSDIYGNTSEDSYYGNNWNGFLVSNAGYVEANADGCAIDLYLTGATELGDVESNGQAVVISNGDMTVDYVSSNDVTLEAHNGSIIGADNGGDSNIDADSAYLYATNSIYGNTSEDSYYGNNTNDFLVTNVNYLEAVVDGQTWGSVSSDAAPVESSSNGFIDIYNNKSVELGNVVVSTDTGEATVVANGDVNVDYVSAPTVTIEAQDGSIIGKDNGGDSNIDADSAYLYAYDSIYGNTSEDTYYENNANDFLVTNVNYLEAVADGNGVESESSSTIGNIDIYNNKSVELGNVVVNANQGEVTVVADGDVNVDYVSAPDMVTLEAQDGSIIGAGENKVDVNANNLYLYASSDIYGNTSEDSYYGNNWNGFLVSNAGYVEANADGCAIDLYLTGATELGDVESNGQAVVISNGDMTVDYVSSNDVTLEAHNGSIIGADNGGDSNIDADSAYLYATNSIYGNTSEDSYYGNNTNDFLVTNVNYLEAVVDGQTWGSVSSDAAPVESSSNGFIDIYNNKSVELGNVVVSTDTGEATVVANGDVNVDYVSAPTVTIEAQDGSIIGKDNGGDSNIDADSAYLYAYDSIYGNTSEDTYYENNANDFLVTNVNYLEAVADGNGVESESSSTIGNIDIYNNKSVELGNVVVNANQGEVTVVADGDVNVDYVSAPTVTIEAQDGSIIGKDNGGDSNIDADSAYLYAYDSIYGNTSEDTYYENNANDFLVTNVNYLEAVADGNGVESESSSTIGNIDIYNNKSVELGNVVVNANQGEVTVVADGDVNVDYVSAPDMVTLEAQFGSIIGNRVRGANINSDQAYLYAYNSIFGNSGEDTYYENNANDFLVTNVNYLEAVADGNGKFKPDFLFSDRKINNGSIDIYNNKSVELGNVVVNATNGETTVVANGDETVDLVSAPTVTLEAQDGSIIGSATDTANIIAANAYLYATDSIYGSTAVKTFYGDNSNDFLNTNVGYVEAVANNGAVDIYNQSDVEFNNVFAATEATLVANGKETIDSAQGTSVTLEATGDISVDGVVADNFIDINTPGFLLDGTYNEDAEDADLITQTLTIRADKGIGTGAVDTAPEITAKTINIYHSLNAPANSLNLVIGGNTFLLPLSTQLGQTQINTFDPISSSSQAGPVFLYHPLTELDSGSYDQFQLDEGAYDFIDDEIKKKKKKGSTA